MKTVLVVDDEDLFLSAVEAGFADALSDVRVLTAPNGRVALQLLDRERVDAVVTDLRMPECDGVELIDRICGENGAIPVIVLTAFGTADTERRLRALGVSDYLEKPVDFQSLAGAVASALSGDGVRGTRGAAGATEEEKDGMSNVNGLLEDAMRIDGAVGVALVDWQSGMCLGTAGGGSVNLELAAAGNTEVVRAKLKVMHALGLNDAIEDILITLGQQYHLIRINAKEPNLFFYLVLNRSQGNLAMARHQLATIEKRLEL